MANKFNLYSRTEEEKTQDIILYEKKAQALEITKRKVNIVTLVAAVAFAAVAFPFFYRAYDSESLLGIAASVAVAAILVIAARLVSGAVFCRSLSVYIKLSSLCSAWTEARKNMHGLEEKFADQTVFEPDLKKAEEALIGLSDKRIEFAKINSRY